MAFSPGNALGLRHYGQMAWRRKWIILLSTLAALCIAVITLAIVPRVYESRVTLQVEDSQLVSSGIERAMGGIGQAPRRYGNDGERMARMVGRIRSFPFLERVVRLLKMNEDPVIRAEAYKRRQRNPEVNQDDIAVRILVASLQSRIRFEDAGSGVMYRVIVADYSPQNAQSIAKWISQLFVDVTNQTALDRIRSANQFGVEQARIYEERLRRSEGALEDYKRSLIDQGLTRRLVRSENLDRALALDGRLADEIAAARQRLKAAMDSLVLVERSPEECDFSGDPEIRGLVDDYVSLLKEEIRQRLGSGGASGGLAAAPDVQWPPLGSNAIWRVRLEQGIQLQTIRRYPELAREASSRIVRFVLAKADVDAQLKVAEMLGGAIADFQRQARAIPQGESELTRLEADVASNRTLLQSFRDQQVASDISQAVEMTNLGTKMAIIDPASLPLSPSKPNRVRVLLASLLLGPLIGAALAFLAETLDPTLRTVQDFANVFPEPTLGSTPPLSRMPGQPSWFRRHRVAITLISVALLGLMFLLSRPTAVQRLATMGRPVQMTSPGSPPNADR